jgi:hypothetical protein
MTVALERMELTYRSEYLRPLLKEWSKLYSEVCKQFPQDGNAYYLEQSLSTLLVAAAWRIEVPGVTEVRVKRAYGGESRSGRADVFVKLDGEVTAIEAKICWFNDDGGLEETLARLRDACLDAASIDKNVAPRRIGLCFGIIERGTTPVAKLLEVSMQRARQENVDILVFAASPDESLSTARYPGCLALGCVVD